MTADPTTLETQLESIRPRLLRLFAARRVGYQAEDFASETLLRVLAAIRRGDTIENLGAYAAGTARRVLLEHFRSRDDFAAPLEPLIETLPGPDDGSGAEEETTEEQDRRLARFRGCLGQLPLDDRGLLTSYYSEGKNKDNREALARTLGITPNALQIRACRVRQTLRSCVTGRGQTAGSGSAERFSRRPALGLGEGQ